MSNLSTINVRVRLTLCLKRKDIMEKENQNVETEQTESTEKVDTQTTDQKEEKTFTQEEVNTIVQERLDKEKKKMPSKDELKEFNEWKESKKTDAEKQAEVLKENETLKNRILELENIQVVANAGVDSKFQKFVFSEVSELEGEFEDNLKDYLKNNPQFLQTTASTPQNTGVAVNKFQNESESGVTAILKAKHPESF